MDNREALSLLKEAQVCIAMEDSRSPIEIAQVLGLIGLDDLEVTTTEVHESTDSQV